MDWLVWLPTSRVFLVLPFVARLLICPDGVRRLATNSKAELMLKASRGLVLLLSFDPRRLSSMKVDRSAVDSTFLPIS